MSAVESIKAMLAREAAEAREVAQAEEAGERKPAVGQRARRQAADPSQVYSVRIPVDRLAQLRALAGARGMAPSALLRQFVLDALDEAAAPVVVRELPPPDPHELRLGPSRSAPRAPVTKLQRDTSTGRLLPTSSRDQAVR